MSDTFVITKINIQGQPRTVYACIEDGRVAEIRPVQSAADGRGILGNIYVGKVKNLAENIGAAFVEIEGGVVCHFKLDELKKYELVFTKHGKSGKLAAGDELLVQVSREASGKKPPTVTGNLSFSGQYLVLTTGKRQTGVSGKIEGSEKLRLKELAAGIKDEQFGLIIRTNAAGVSEEQLSKEYRRLKDMAVRTEDYGANLAVFSLVYKEPPAYLTRLKSLKEECLSKIVTDCPDIYEEVSSYLGSRMPDRIRKLSLYEGDSPSLDAVYGLAGALEEALKPKVWLKSGGYLVIEPTEALTVIDVNTGRFTGRRHRGDAILKTNLEAADEIARQLRLRNLSGIIVIDFIDLETESDRELLMESLSRALKKDPVKCELVDMTPLGLVEVTRKKTMETLREACLRP